MSKASSRRRPTSPSSSTGAPAISERAIPVNPSISMTLTRCVSRCTVEALATAGRTRSGLRPRRCSRRPRRRFRPPRARTTSTQLRGRWAGSSAAPGRDPQQLPRRGGLASSASGFAALAPRRPVPSARRPPRPSSRTSPASPARARRRARSSAATSSGRAAARRARKPRAEQMAPRRALGPARRHRGGRDRPQGGLVARRPPPRAVQPLLRASAWSCCPPDWRPCAGAIRDRDLRVLGPILEEEAIDLHLIAMSSEPPIFYWSPGTVAVLRDGARAAPGRALRLRHPGRRRQRARHLRADPRTTWRSAWRTCRRVGFVIRDGVGAGPDSTPRICSEARSKVGRDPRSGPGQARRQPAHRQASGRPPRREVITAGSRESWRGRRQRIGVGIVLGHGSGSFGHTRPPSSGSHRAFAPPTSCPASPPPSSEAAELHRLVVSALRGRRLALLPRALELPGHRSRPAGRGAWIRCSLALEGGLLPVIYGDVVLDREQGAAICSTETVLAACACRLPAGGFRLIRAPLWLGETRGLSTPTGGPCRGSPPDRRRRPSPGLGAARRYGRHRRHAPPPGDRPGPGRRLRHPLPAPRRPRARPPRTALAARPCRAPWSVPRTASSPGGSSGFD